MKERSRLGRGLEEVSRFYLSDPPPVPLREEPVQEGRKQLRVVRVVHPGGGPVGAFFAANLCLELARGGRRVTLLGGTGEEGEGVEAVLGRVLHRGQDSGSPRVRLYGLHDIPVHRSLPDGGEALERYLQEASGGSGERWAVIHAPQGLETLARSSEDSDVLLLSEPDWKSLLRCYAWVKVIGQRREPGRVSVVLVDPESPERAREVFSRFSAFVAERLGVRTGYLGHLLRDEVMERSMEEHYPLVLGYEPSDARDSLTAVVRAFLEEPVRPDGRVE